jgi:hypothetical protein
MTVLWREKILVHLVVGMLPRLHKCIGDVPHQ